MEKRPGFILYKSFYEPIKNLSLEQKGKLLDALFKTQLNPNNPVGFDDKSVEMAFSFFANQFVYDDEKYLKTVQRNRTNGLKGGRKKNPVGAKKANKDKDKDKEYISNDIYTRELKKILQVWNELRGEKRTSIVALEANYRYWRKEYSAEDILEAVRKHQLTWLKKVSLETFLRQGNGREKVDYIAQALNAKKIDRRGEDYKPQYFKDGAWYRDSNGELNMNEVHDMKERIIKEKLTYYEGK